jgi:hypothetical protein
MKNKNYQPNPQDLTLYSHILDFNSDGRVSLEDFEALAVKYLARTEKKYLSHNKETTQRMFENVFK